MTRAYAIGDVHGHLGELVRAHRRIRADRERTGDAEAPVVHLGDLVDRGPESAEVIEYLLMGLASGEPWVARRAATPGRAPTRAPGSRPGCNRCTTTTAP